MLVVELHCKTGESQSAKAKTKVAQGDVEIAAHQAIGLVATCPSAVGRDTRRQNAATAMPLAVPVMSGLIKDMLFHD